MTRDLVMGVATGYTWPELRPYAVSLAKCGFEGEKLMFVNGLAPETVYKLESLGFSLIEFELPKELADCDSQSNVGAWTILGQYRHFLAERYLKEHTGKFRFVLWTDVRDVVFQTDPFEWIAEHLKEPYSLIAARECWRIVNQPHNNQWARFTAPAEYDWLKEQEVLCAGTIAGTAETMLKLHAAIYAAAQTLDPRSNDQGIFNYIVRKAPFLELCIVPNMAAGFVATGWNTKRYEPYAYSTDDAPVFNVGDYVVYTPDGVTPFVISHQYDRDGNWRYCIEKIMETADA